MLSLVTIGIKLYILTVLGATLAVYFALHAVPMLAILKSFLWTFVTTVHWIKFLMGLSCFAIAATVKHIQSKSPAKRFRLLDVLLIYGGMQAVKFYCWRALRRIRQGTRNIESSQNRVLMDILKHAKTTAYYQENSFGEITTIEAFVSRRPLTKYDHYREWIDRIIDGEHGVLQTKNVELLVATTGTTSGISKLYPKNIKLIKQLLLRELMAYFSPMLKLPKVKNIKPIFDLGLRLKSRWTSKGLKIAAMSGSFMDIYGRISAAPSSARNVPDMHDAIYCQLLFALREREVGYMLMGFGSHAYTVFKMAADRWRDLTSDIRNGTINSSVSNRIPAYLLNDMLERLSPNPERADELTNIFSSGQQGWVPKAWADASIIQTIVTGPFLIYRKMLEENYTGNVTLLSAAHGATESVYGTNIWPGQVPEEYVILPSTVFYEFIDMELYDNEFPSTVMAHQVEIGKRYEIVVTTYDGLYRYRTNDVIEITRFYNTTPVYSFLQRADDNLSVYAEKTPVSEVISAVEHCVRQWPNCDVADYTTTESINLKNLLTTDTKQLLHYVIIIEVDGTCPSNHLALQVDEYLRKHVEAYDINREKGRIGPLDVIYTAKGAFGNLQQMILGANRDASSAQYKTPRLIRQETKLKCLLDLQT